MITNHDSLYCWQQAERLRAPLQMNLLACLFLSLLPVSLINIFLYCMAAHVPSLQSEEQKTFGLFSAKDSFLSAAYFSCLNCLTQSADQS